jgi:hypothetical protein
MPSSQSAIVFWEVRRGHPEGTRAPPHLPKGGSVGVGGVDRPHTPTRRSDGKAKALKISAALEIAKVPQGC